MDPNLCLDVPPDFDDSDADAQVHPIARLLFMGRTNAEVFGKVQEWTSVYNVLIVDMSVNFLYDEPEPVQLTVYFAFEDEDSAKFVSPE
ncbi:hypothetical protein SAMN05421630_107334 [Prauserella marina]|uniref:Uncharacterized protein n=1 Tax=Prauserella marina TaxID=530584 RepID=A0A1G6TYI6_9PSEU|nr:hypothetical protein [Prauserella marina]PWV75491.1 hypothetical protein DES30_106106 [Prauserella marina]SDD33355.1 hypothetical protein SAMN05421630_107334 [Prauserella marina]